jgi:transposase
MIQLNLSFNKFLKNVIINDVNVKKYYNKSFPNSKYSLDVIIDGIIYILKTGISWRDFIHPSIHWNSLFFHFNRFVKFNIFKKAYLKLKASYLKSNNDNIFIIDSSFVQNKYGKNLIARNKFYKNKFGNKISLITDSHGIPISIFLNKGNIHDLSFIDKHLRDLFIIKNNAPHILLADKAYTSTNTRNKLALINCSIMVPNKLNAKNKLPFDKKLYKKRIIIEHTFQKLKNFRRINMRYDSYFSTFLSFIFLSASIIIFKKINC